MEASPPPPRDENVGPEGDAALAGKPRVLPFSNWWPLAIGALTGIVLRLILPLGKPGGAYAAMEAAFVYLVPTAVGAVTVFVAEAKQRRAWSYYVWAPVVANFLFVLGTMAILIEGLICAIIILPLFCALGALGGVVMGAICPRHSAAPGGRIQLRRRRCRCCWLFANKRGRLPAHRDDRANNHC